MSDVIEVIKTEGGRVEVRGKAIVMAGGGKDLEVVVNENSIADVRVLVENDATITARLVNAGSNIKSRLRIWTIARNVDVSGVLRIEKGCKDVDASLEIRSLGMGGKVVQKPWLEAYSNEIKARHSASMITFSNHQLFYMSTRGLKKRDAVLAVVDEIKEMFSSTEMSVE